MSYKPGIEILTFLAHFPRVERPIMRTLTFPSVKTSMRSIKKPMLIIILLASRQ